MKELKTGLQSRPEENIFYTMKFKCPGMDPQHWKLQDIFEQTCPRCASQVEIWKDDIKRKCPRCGHELTNAKIRESCLAWCDQASACIGTMEIVDWKIHFNNQPPNDTAQK